MYSSRLAAFLLLTLVAGCGENESDLPAATSDSAPQRREGDATRTSPTGADEPARPIDPTTTGRLSGTVSFQGEPPRRATISGPLRSECGHAGPEALSERVIVNDGRVENVYVYVQRGLSGWIPPAPPEQPVLLDQRGCIYSPHVLALQVGTPLHVRNSDTTNHNVNVRAPKNDRSGNRNMGPGQNELVFDFTRDERKILFKCDIHPWMSAWLHVAEHPFFAVTAADGTWAIEGLPPGDYMLEFLHEELDKGRLEVTVRSGETTTADLTLE